MRKAGNNKINNNKGQRNLKSIYVYKDYYSKKLQEAIEIVLTRETHDVI